MSGGSGKRGSPESEQGSQGERESPIPKRQRMVTFDPVRLSSVSSVNDLDLQTLAFQNRKLNERLQYRQKLENNLRYRIEQLEKRQTQDDALIGIINRFWNRLDEDMHLLLQRFDAETSHEDEAKKEDSSTSSFLNGLSQWDDKEVEEKLTQRVEFTRRYTAKLVQTFDRVSQRNQQISKLIVDGPDKEENGDKKEDGPKLDELVVQKNKELTEENKRLQSIVTKLQNSNHTLSLKHSKYDDVLNGLETKMEEKDSSLEEAYFQLERQMQREEKLEFRTAEMHKQLEAAQLKLEQAETLTSDITTSSAASCSSSSARGKDDIANVSKNKLEELQQSLEEQKELAANRLTELQELKESHSQKIIQLEKMKMDLKHLPASLILESSEYKALQSQFTVLLMEAQKIREHAEGLRSTLKDTRSKHLKQIEQIEAEELMAQKQLRMEMIQLEEQLSQVRREYEMLRLEFEQNLAANEQSGPVNREMRQLLGTYKTQNTQLKSEVARYKKKWKEAISGIAKVQKELDSERKLKENSVIIEVGESSDNNSKAADEIAEPDEEDLEAEDELEDISKANIEQLRKYCTMYKEKWLEAKAKLKALDSMSADERDKVTMTVREDRLKLENLKFKKEIERMAKEDRKDKMKYYQEEALKRIRHLEEQNEKLKKEAGSSKAEEDTLLTEMEVTGQAVEEMQDQNARLMQQLKEKDDAHFKLMSERIRSNQQQKKLKEEKDLVDEQVGALSNQVEAQNMVVRKLEEKERLLQHNLTTLEKELTALADETGMTSQRSTVRLDLAARALDPGKRPHVEQLRTRLRTEAVELNKRKAMEFAQSSADLKLQVEKLTSQLNDANGANANKTTTLSEHSFRICRLQEELSLLKKHLERAKKMQSLENIDVVLMEEIKELKGQLTCPSCKVQKKDAILTKCFHVFCMECLKTRYDTRRRKCPKCNAAFGANDFRRIYIA